MLVWGDGYLYGACGKVGVTNRRLLFVKLDSRPDDHPLLVNRKATVADGT